MRSLLLVLSCVLAPSVYAQAPVYSRGDAVTLTASDDGRPLPNGKVLAVAGDRVRIARTGVVVNGAVITGLSPEFLAQLPTTASEETVPDGHYFVVAELRDKNSVSRSWGVFDADRIRGRI